MLRLVVDPSLPTLQAIGLNGYTEKLSRHNHHIFTFIYSEQAPGLFYFLGYLTWLITASIYKNYQKGCCCGPKNQSSPPKNPAYKRNNGRFFSFFTRLITKSSGEHQIDQSDPHQQISKKGFRGKFIAGYLLIIGSVYASHILQKHIETTRTPLAKQGQTSANVRNAISGKCDVLVSYQKTRNYRVV